jgi:RNA polymerase sigma-19 factor, ECF subfamily
MSKLKSGNDSDNIVYLNTSQGQNADLLAKLFSEHRESLKRFLRVRLALEADREDIIQSVFLRLALIGDLASKFQNRSDTVRSYLFSIANNLVNDSLRRTNSRKEVSSDSFQDDIIHDFSPDESPSFLSSTERVLQGRQELLIIKNALLNVKSVQRQAFVMSRFHHMSYREVADILGISISSVEKHISAVLCAMRQETKDRG